MRLKGGKRTSNELATLGAEVELETQSRGRWRGMYTYIAPCVVAMVSDYGWEDDRIGGLVKLM